MSRDVSSWHFVLDHSPKWAIKTTLVVRVYRGLYRRLYGDQNRPLWQDLIQKKTGFNETYPKPKLFQTSHSRHLQWYTEVWFTHAMLLHFAEMEHDAAALAGAQILPSASWIFDIAWKQTNEDGKSTMNTKMYFLWKMGMFQWYVGFQGCRSFCQNFDHEGFEVSCLPHRSEYCIDIWIWVRYFFGCGRLPSNSDHQDYYIFM